MCLICVTERAWRSAQGLDGIPSGHVHIPPPWGWPCRTWSLTLKVTLFLTAWRTTTSIPGCFFGKQSDVMSQRAQCQCYPPLMGSPQYFPPGLALTYFIWTLGHCCSGGREGLVVQILLPSSRSLCPWARCITLDATCMVAARHWCVNGECEAIVKPFGRNDASKGLFKFSPFTQEALFQSENRFYKYEHFGFW